MTFFQNGRKYAVIGVSSLSFKYGYKVFDWYIKEGLPVLGVNPKGGEILGLKIFKNICEYLEINKNEQLSLSFITPPKQSFKVLEEIVKNGFNKNIKNVWFQPGSYDNEVIKYVREKYELNEDEIIKGCILIDGRYKLRESEMQNNIYSKV